MDENTFFCKLSVKLNQTPANISHRRNVWMYCIFEENPKECQISGSKWFARSNKVEAEGSQCNRDAHCVGARSLFWVVCTVHCTDCALCIEQILHCALKRLYTVHWTDCALCIERIVHCALHRFWTVHCTYFGLCLYLMHKLCSIIIQ